MSTLEAGTRQPAQPMSTNELLDKYLPIAEAAVVKCPFNHASGHLESVMRDVIHTQKRKLEPLPAHVFDGLANWTC